MWGAIATAAAMAVAPGSYGGGVVPTAAQANAGASLALVSLRVHAGTPTELYVITTADCGRGGLYQVELRDPRVELEDDGSLSYADDGDHTYDDSGGTLDTTWELEATYADGNLSGTLKVTSKRRGKTCRTGTKSEWQARNPTAGADDSAPLPGTPYFGVTSQVVAGHYPAPIVLRTSGNGQRLEGAQWLASARCRRQPNDLFVNTTPKTDFANRRFERNERFSVRYVEGVADFRALLAGRFTAVGADGTLRLREAWHRSKRNKRKVTDRCDSGTVSWRAAP